MSIFDRLRAGLRAGSPEETIDIARQVASQLPRAATLTLRGELGSGKTTFVKGLAQQWRIEEPITSPTFNILALYRGERTLLHVDAYRLDPATDILEELMLEEFMTPPYCLAIEWPSHIGPLPWPVDLALSLAAQPDHSRLIQLD